MKNLISIIVILLVAAGCSKTENATETETQTKSNVEKLQAENKRLEAELKKKQNKLKAEPSLKEARAERIATAKNKRLKEDLLKLSVVGSYEAEIDVGKIEKNTTKIVLFENGVVELYENGEKLEKDIKWKIVEKEVHADVKPTLVFKVEPNGDLTCIASIRDGKRTELPNEAQGTWKTLKE